MVWGDFWSVGIVLGWYWTGLGGQWIVWVVWDG